LPFDDAAFDAAVSGLVLNFVPDPARMVSEMRRVVVGGGCVAAYVWDFDGGGSVSQHIAKALASRNSSHARTVSAAQQAGVTRLDSLTSLFVGAGLASVEARPIEIPVHFRDFDDYWSANTGFRSPTTGQLAALSSHEREAVERQVKESLLPGENGAVEYLARANAVRGSVPD
jgi:ubiquinone/menaquinone biosynthesis C-methylase UbiE